MANVIGHFYFKLSDHGNLLGEYSSDRATTCDVEAAIRTSDYPSNPANDGELFVGEYLTVWTEGKKTRKSILKIERKVKSTDLFTLSWRNNSKGVLFTGQGMVVDKILIGIYQTCGSESRQ